MPHSHYTRSKGADPDVEALRLTKTPDDIHRSLSDHGGQVVALVQYVTNEDSISPLEALNELLMSHGQSTPFIHGLTSSVVYGRKISTHLRILRQQIFPTVRCVLNQGINILDMASRVVGERVWFNFTAHGALRLTRELVVHIYQNFAMIPNKSVENLTHLFDVLVVMAAMDSLGSITHRTPEIIRTLYEQIVGRSAV